MSTLLIIDDDKEFRLFLEETLANFGYDILTAIDGKSGIEKAVLHRPDMILLDLLMPGMDGKDVCLFLTSNPKTQDIPVIMITGEADICDEAEGLNLGAVDYVSKPVHIRALKARIEKELNRPRSSKIGSKKDGAYTTLTLGMLDLNIKTQTLTIGKNETCLSPIEFKILSALMDNPGSVVSHEALIHDIWDQKSENTVRMLDNHIRNIRKKLGNYRNYLQTLYKRGYFVREPADTPRIS